MPQRYIKDPQAELDYSIDWTSLLSDGDAIIESTWSAEEGIDVMESPAPSNTATVTTVWLSGGTAGDSYNVVNLIETSAGRVDARTIRIEVRPK